jgi:hydroxymethylglutaryl-CoA lyase
MREPVKIIECPRDAWQGLPGQIPTELKVQYLNDLIAAGFRHIDAVSFVSPKAVPQMADSEAVLAQLRPSGDVEIIGIVVNEKGAERAIATKRVSTLGFPCSVSPTFLRRNQNQTIDENLAVLKTIKRRADDAGLDMVVYISMAFGNPYGDPWSAPLVARASEQIAELGVPALSLADTVGAADANLIAQLLGSIFPRLTGIEVGVHLHSTCERSAEKVLVAYDAGCRRFDSAVGGLGGCPFAQDALVGNLPTEELLRALEIRGADSTLRKLDAVSRLNAEIEEKFSH